MARKKRVPDNARRITILLTPAEKLVLSVIEARRQQRDEDRDSPSEIVSDALWRFLTEVEKMTREEIEALLPKVALKNVTKSKVSTIFSKKGS
jgi:IMP dehydrogenase/GMP reductase